MVVCNETHHLRILQNSIHNSMYSSVYIHDVKSSTLVQNSTLKSVLATIYKCIVSEISTEFSLERLSWQTFTQKVSISI